MPPSAQEEPKVPSFLDEDVVFRDEHERAEWVYRELVKTYPELADVSALEHARQMLHRFFASRNLTPTAEEQARIDACTDVATVDRWVEQAAVATCVAEALA